MKRRFIFSMLLVLSVLLLSSTGYSQQQVSDFGALKIRAVGDNVGLLFLFEGTGPHVVAFGSETPDITVIDPRGPGLGKIIVDKVHNAADGPVITIINTGPHRAGSNAEFPDATTSRGTKHLNELSNAKKKGYRSYILYLIQREDCDSFKIANDIDKEYKIAFNKALKSGVKILCYDCKLNNEEIKLNNQINYE